MSGDLLEGPSTQRVQDHKKDKFKFLIFTFKLLNVL